MISLPDFNKMYDYETNYHLTLNVTRLTKFIAHYEAYKMVRELPGSIIECGVFKGTSITRFALFRELLGNYFSTKIIGFDVYSDDYPDTDFQEDKAQRKHWIETAGGSSISTKQLEEIFSTIGIKNFEFVAGDITQTVPQYIKDHPAIKVSLLNIDCDFVEPTKSALEHFYGRMVQGGIILLDNYAGEGTAGDSCYGDTKAADDFFKDKKEKIKKFHFGSRPCYVIKE